MKSHLIRIGLTGFVFVAMAMLTAETTSAQCSTCATPVVAYQPVAVQPVVTTQYTGWYPGKMLDSMRLRRYDRRYSVAAPMAPAYTPYTASYAPYTAAYPTYSTGYTPYVTAYAPLRRTVVARPIVQTAYYPAAMASPCSTCVQTVARPVVLRPIVTAGCGGCSSCSGVGQAAFLQPSTQPGCSSCATPSVVPSYPATPSLAPTGQGVTVGPPTPQPALVPNEPAPAQSNYPATGTGQGTVDPLDPIPEVSPNTDTTFEAPRLFDPSDRTAQRSSSNGPTVDVWNAVYQKTGSERVKQMAFQQTNGKSSRTQAEIDADGWQSVPRSR